MTAKPLGPINSSQLLALMRACLENAQAIRDDADLLFAGGRYSRAAYLYAISLEELGKIPMLARCPEFGDDRRLWRRFWKRFRSHEQKLSTRIGEIYNALVSPKTASLMRWFMRSMDVMKQRTLYVDFEHDDAVSPANVPAPRIMAEGLRLVLAAELPYHRFVLGHLTQEVLDRVGYEPSPEPMPHESAADFLTRIADHNRSRLGFDLPQRQPGQDTRSYALRVYGPLFEGIWDSAGGPLDLISSREDAPAPTEEGPRGT